MPSDKIMNLTTASFEETVLKSEIPVLVDFWAVWCGPCRMLAPILDEIADEAAGKALVCKVDVDAEGALAEKFNIMTVPTLIVFKKGEVAERSSGARGKDDIMRMLGI